MDFRNGKWNIIKTDGVCLINYYADKKSSTPSGWTWNPPEVIVVRRVDVPCRRPRSGGSRPSSTLESNRRAVERFGNGTRKERNSSFVVVATIFKPKDWNSWCSTEPFLFRVHKVAPCSVKLRNEHQYVSDLICFSVYYITSLFLTECSSFLAYCLVAGTQALCFLCVVIITLPARLDYSLRHLLSAA